MAKAPLTYRKAELATIVKIKRNLYRVAGLKDQIGKITRVWGKSLGIEVTFFNPITI